MNQTTTRMRGMNRMSRLSKSTQKEIQFGKTIVDHHPKETNLDFEK